MVDGDGYLKGTIIEHNFVILGLRRLCRKLASEKNIRWDKKKKKKNDIPYVAPVEFYSYKLVNINSEDEETEICS